VGADNWNLSLIAGLLGFFAAYSILQADEKPEGDDRDIRKNSAISGSVVTIDLFSVDSIGYPVYETKEDALFWLQHFYQHPDLSICSRAVRILLTSFTPSTEKFDSERYFLNGLLSSLFRRFPDRVTEWTREWMEAAKTPQQRALVLLSVWSSSTSTGRELLERMHINPASFGLSESESTLITAVRPSPPPDFLRAIGSGDKDALAASVKVPMLSAAFSVSGSEVPLLRLLEITQFWTPEWASQDLNMFFSGLEARNELVQICIAHPTAYNILNEWSNTGFGKTNADLNAALLTVVNDATEKRQQLQETASLA
jgi:hypothetical protein